MARALHRCFTMFRHRHHVIQVGDRVRSYDLPGLSDRDYVSGTVTGHCLLAGIPRVIIQSASLTVHGQEEPCLRIFYAPVHSVVSEQDPGVPPDLHRVA